MKYKSILPLECLYLNKNALHAQVGHLPPSVKHFTLKRKSKSAALRAELLQRSSETATTKKSATTSLGNRVGISDIAPKNISRIALPTTLRTQSRIVPSRPPIRKDGGIKLLDISEQPFGRDLKRKKKNPDEKDKDEKANENESTTTSTTTTTDEPNEETNKPFYPEVLPPPTLPAASAPPTVVPTSPKKPLPSQPQPQQQPQQPIQQVQQPTQSTVIQQTPHPTYIVSQAIQPVTLTPTQVGFGGGERRLVLSREQMAAAQEMFRNAPCLSRPEKALILGFMAGSRDNPCPQLGNVATIKLSEREETFSQDGMLIPVRVETHYQMNYATGEGKQIMKYLRIECTIAS